MYQEAIRNYLRHSPYTSLSLRSVLFDMDGVLFNSMPYHAEAWYHAMTSQGHTFSHKEAYLHEGRTGAGTINIVYNREYHRDATPEEIQALYQLKTQEFNKHPQAEPLPGAREMLQQVKAAGLVPTVVTGSAQDSLLGKLEHFFPGTFRQELMVTAYDVTYGKPDPEPYLIALQKGGLQANEAIVIENAPLGVESAHRAGIFTIAVNTGPLEDRILLDAGADLLFPSMQALCNQWLTLHKELKNTSI
ncbi:MAG: HAD-IA family hydrolase [Bacteroides sp.]|nr:HAD-IA family hydrolase [Bacteroides sp.]